MAKKKTLEELKKAMEDAEKRAADKAEEYKRRLAKEEAKANTGIIDALKKWQRGLPDGDSRKVEWVDMPSLLKGLLEGKLDLIRVGWEPSEDAVEAPEGGGALEAEDGEAAAADEPYEADRYPEEHGTWGDGGI